MKIKVLKFGGSSVANVDAIKKSGSIISSWSKKYKVIVVLSAMYGETDRLIQLTKSFSKNPVPREYDVAVSTGETVSCSLMSIYLNSIKIPSKSLMGWQIPINTSSNYSKARIISINNEKLINELKVFFIINTQFG